MPICQAVLCLGFLVACNEGGLGDNRGMRHAFNACPEAHSPLANQCKECVMERVIH